MKLKPYLPENTFYLNEDTLLFFKKPLVGLLTFFEDPEASLTDW